MTPQPVVTVTFPDTRDVYWRMRRDRGLVIERWHIGAWDDYVAGIYRVRSLTRKNRRTWQIYWCPKGAPRSEIMTGDIRADVVKAIKGFERVLGHKIR